MKEDKQGIKRIFSIGLAVLLLVAGLFPAGLALCGPGYHGGSHRLPGCPSI